MTTFCPTCGTHAKTKDCETLRPLDDWHEDFGPVLWWTVPIGEPPWCGTPLDSDWPGYHTHWSPLPQHIRNPKG